MINVGIIGYGYAGRCFHAYLTSLAEGLKLCAVASRDPGRREAAARDYGVTTYETIDHLLQDSRVDLVVIATPHDTHAPLAIQAMNAGRHVVVDKVMCLTAAEADEMIAASQRNGVILSVFHNRRWDWDFLTVKQAITDGLLGHPFLFETAVMRYRPSHGWRMERARSGGLLFDWGAHLVDQALQLVPSDPVTVFCDAQKHRWDGDIEDHLKCVIRFRDGTLYIAEISNLARLSKPRWYILGTRGSLVKEGLDPQEGPMVRGNIDAAVEDPHNRAQVSTDLNGMTADIVLESVKGSWKSYYQNIADVLNHGAELAVRPEEVRRAMTVLDAARRSVETGETVKV